MATSKTPVTEGIESTYVKYSPFFSEIRKRLIFTFCLLIIVSVVGFIYADKVIGLIVEAFGIKGVNIVFTSPFQFINLSISIALLMGTIILFPLIIFQLVSFLKPALTKKEFRLILYLIPVSIVLFIGGAIFGMVIMRYILGAFYIQAEKLSLGNFLDISNLISHVLIISVLMGVTFQFPVVMTILMRLKIIRHATVTKKRFWIYAGAAILAGLLPPADIPSTIVYFLILVLLFELSLLLNKYVLRSHLL